MKKFVQFVPILFILLILIVFSACSENTTADTSTDKTSSFADTTLLTPRKLELDYYEYSAQCKNNLNKNLIFDTYEDYETLGIDLDYTEGYFTDNSLLVILKVGCDEDDYELVNVYEIDGVLHPIFNSNTYGDCDDSATDMKLFAFIFEYNSTMNFQFAEEILRTR
jgi:hypothetical protein